MLFWEQSFLRRILSPVSPSARAIIAGSELARNRSPAFKLEETTIVSSLRIPSPPSFFRNIRVHQSWTAVGGKCF
jgi:hypothetical protein